MSSNLAVSSKNPSFQKSNVDTKPSRAVRLGPTIMIDKYPERTEMAYIKRGGQWSRCLHELEVAHALRLLHNLNAQVVGTFEPSYMGLRAA